MLLFAPHWPVSVEDVRILNRSLLVAAAAMMAALHASVALCSSAAMACLVGIPVGIVVYTGASFTVRSLEAQESLRILSRAARRRR